MTYEMDIAGLKRDLPLCKVSDDLYIGAFVMFGDVELTVHCAAELLKLTPEYDYLIAPEAKAIPLVYEMARQSGADKYFVARKKAKAYMSSVFQVHVKSITCLLYTSAGAGAVGATTYPSQDEEMLAAEAAYSLSLIHIFPERF